MIDRYLERHGRRPQSLAADTTYGNGELLHAGLLPERSAN
jgi:hypothetical protein